MLLRMQYKDYVGSKVKYTDGEDIKGKALAFVEVGLEEAFYAHRELAEKEPSALFYYTGDTQSIRGTDFTGIRLIVEHDLRNLDEQGVNQVISSLLMSENPLHESVTQVFTLGDQVKNLRMLHSLCVTYPNIRFKGIPLLTIEGLNVGYADVPLLLTGKSSSEPVSDGEYEIIDKTETMLLEVIGEKKPTVKIPRIKKEKVPKPVGEPKAKKEEKPKQEKKEKPVKKSFDYSFM